MKFPDFIIIGSMKCATTVLWHNLNKHPDIFMAKNPEDPKKASTELRFWNNGQPHFTWERKGLDWYKSLFDENKCCGEKCANYIEQAVTMKRMSEYIPDVKLIICVRNPVDRAYSEYNMQKKKGLPPFSIDLAQKRGYLYRGLYYQQLQNNVLPFFERKNIYVVVQEELKADTNLEINKIYDFLGVSRHNLNIENVKAEEATNRDLDLDEDNKIQKYKNWSSQYLPMEDHTRNQLSDYFRLENIALFDFLGKPIESWV